MITKKKLIKEFKVDTQKKLEELDRLMLGLNAFGSLDLKDYNILVSFIKGAFDYKIEDE